MANERMAEILEAQCRQEEAFQLSQEECAPMRTREPFDSFTAFAPTADMLAIAAAARKASDEGPATLLRAMEADMLSLASNEPPLTEEEIADREEAILRDAIERESRCNVCDGEGMVETYGGMRGCPECTPIPEDPFYD